MVLFLCPFISWCCYLAVILHYCWHYTQWCLHLFTIFSFIILIYKCKLSECLTLILSMMEHRSPFSLYHAVCTAKISNSIDTEVRGRRWPDVTSQNGMWSAKEEQQACAAPWRPHFEAISDFILAHSSHSVWIPLFFFLLTFVPEYTHTHTSALCVVSVCYCW